MQIQANGIILEACESGPDNGPTLILVRGLGSQLIHWPAELSEGFATAGFRVVMFDNRDVGLSQRCPLENTPVNKAEILSIASSGEKMLVAYTLADMARDVIGLMDALKIETAHIFGISMGGVIAQLLCIENPERLLSATMAMTSADPLAGDPRNIDRLCSFLAHPMVRKSYVESWLREHASNGGQRFPMATEEIRAEAELAWSRGVDPEGINRQALATFVNPEHSNKLIHVDLPCLVLHGTEDTLIPARLGAELAALIPDCEYQTIVGMGHIITPRLAPLIVRLVTDFLKRNSY